MLLQHRQLVEGGGIEDHISLLLEGEDPPPLAPADALPHAEGILDGGAAGLEVPDSAAQKPQVAGGNAVVVIQVQGDQGTDIEAEYTAIVDALGQQHGVQGVEALDDDDGLRGQTHGLAVPFPLAGLEIEVGQLDLLAVQELCHVAGEEVGVQGVDVLQITLAIRAEGHLLPVNVVVIHAHEDGLLAVDPELGGQTVGRSGLAGGTGACQHDGLGVALADHVGDPGEFLLVEGFVDPDQLPDAAGGRQIVQVSHRLALHQLAPALAFVEDIEEIGAFQIGGGLAGVAPVGVDEEKAVVRRLDVPARQVAGGGHHLAVVVVGKVTMGVLIEVVEAAPGQEPGLIQLAVGLEMGDGRFLAHPAAQEGDVLFRQCRHPGLELTGVEIIDAADLHVDAGADGAVHLGHRIGPQLAHGQKNGKLGGTDVCLLTQVVPVAQQAHHAAGGRHGPAGRGLLHLSIRHPDRDVVQGKDLTGDLRRQGLFGQALAVQSHGLHQLQQALAGHRFHGSSVDHQLHKEHLTFLHKS